MDGFDTEWPADSVEFCPHPDARNVFACGTYRLEHSEEQPNHAGDESTTLTPKKQIRRGKCLLFEAREDEDRVDKIAKVQELTFPAILDMKWCHRDTSVSPILAIADSEGHISIHEYDLTHRILHRVQAISCASHDVLCLSLDWSNRRYSTSGLGSLVVSLSDKTLAILRPDNQSGLIVTDTWHAHEFEPWIAAWNYWDVNVIYSGGDDLKMKGWDVRQGLSQPIFTNKRFDAGVTTIQSHPYIEHIIAVGSYDNTVRLFDTRKPQVPLVTTDVGGGAWRVKWHPSATRKSDLLVACMHDGFKVVRFGTSFIDGSEIPQWSSEWDILQRFDKHESLAYGVDWSLGTSKRDKTLIASCSFYDHLLHVWRG